MWSLELSKLTYAFLIKENLSLFGRGGRTRTRTYRFGHGISTVLKTAVLPLHYTPNYLNLIYISSILRLNRTRYLSKDYLDTTYSNQYYLLLPAARTNRHYDLPLSCPPIMFLFITNLLSFSFVWHPILIVTVRRHSI